MDWKGTKGKGKSQALYSTSHQVMNGLGLCMFTMLTGPLPWLELVNGLTAWDFTEEDLMRSGERIQSLRAAFNWREGLAPGDFKPHNRMTGTGDGMLQAGPLKGVSAPLVEVRTDFFRNMHWDPETGHLQAARAKELGIDSLLEGYLS